MCFPNNRKYIGIGIGQNELKISDIGKYGASLLALSAGCSVSAGEAELFLLSVLCFREACDRSQRSEVQEHPREEERHQLHRRPGFSRASRLRHRHHRHRTQPQSGHQTVRFAPQTHARSPVPPLPVRRVHS